MLTMGEEANERQEWHKCVVKVETTTKDIDVNTLKTLVTLQHGGPYCFLPWVPWMTPESL